MEKKYSESTDIDTSVNDIDKMMPMCHDCPYWEVCKPPYICAVTEEKYRK